MKIAISAGGTGGHIYPGIALARELAGRGEDREIFFIGSKNGLEGRLLKDQNFKLYQVPSRSFSANFLTAPFVNIVGLVMAFLLLLRERPAVLVSFGGYTSFAAVVSAWLLKVPVVIHEQNILPGKTNRFLSRFAGAVALSFEPSLKYLKGMVTGNPVRKEIRGLKKVPSKKWVVLVLGGSQGALSINRELICSLDLFRDKNIEIVHLIGKRDYAAFYGSRDFSAYPFYQPVPYMYNIEEAYKRAHLVVSRAGATAIAEILSVSLPSILVPFPYAAEGHQDLNAEYVERAGAGIKLPDSRLIELPDIIFELLENKEGRLDKMSRAAAFLAKPDAAAKLADIVEGLAKA